MQDCTIWDDHQVRSRWKLPWAEGLYVRNLTFSIKSAILWCCALLVQSLLALTASGLVLTDLASRVPALPLKTLDSDPCCFVRSSADTDILEIKDSTRLHSHCASFA